MELGIQAKKVPPLTNLCPGPLDQITDPVEEAQSLRGAVGTGQLMFHLKPASNIVPIRM